MIEAPSQTLLILINCGRSPSSLCPDTVRLNLWICIQFLMVPCPPEAHSSSSAESSSSPLSTILSRRTFVLEFPIPFTGLLVLLWRSDCASSVKACCWATKWASWALLNSCVCILNILTSRRRSSSGGRLEPASNSA
jgi:hypothetical protein